MRRCVSQCRRTSPIGLCCSVCRYVRPLKAARIFTSDRCFSLNFRDSSCRKASQSTRWMLMATTTATTNVARPSHSLQIGSSSWQTRATSPRQPLCHTRAAAPLQSLPFSRARLTARRRSGDSALSKIRRRTIAGPNSHSQCLRRRYPRIPRLRPSRRRRPNRRRTAQSRRHRQSPAHSLWRIHQFRTAVVSETVWPTTSTATPLTAAPIDSSPSTRPLNPTSNSPASTRAME